MSTFKGIGAVAALTAACAGSPSSERRLLASWPVDPSAGITTLSMTYAPHVKIGASRVVTNAEELRDAWEYFGFRGPIPKVPFEERRVVVFVEGGVCGGGSANDRGGTPVIGAWLVDGGGVIPILEELEQIACEEGYTGPPTGYAYALSIPRSASEGPLYVVHGVYPKHDMRPEFSGQAPRNFETESSALPSPGEAVLVVRADHAPVWVVRHPDGSSSALGAEYEPMPEWLPGFRSLVRFQQGRFLGPFDPWGTHLSGAQAGLERYQLRVREGRLEIGASLGRVPPGRPRSTPRSNAEPRALPDFFEGVPRRGVSEALEQPQGTLSVLRGRARLEPGRLAVFCEGDATSFRDCATIVDLRASEDCHGTLSGDFALRREGAGFAHLIALSAGEVAYSCRTDDGERPWWGRGGSFGLAPWTAALSLGAYAGLAGSEPQAGLDASATLRFRHRRSLARSFWDARLGHVFELGVRAHWFDELGEHAQPAWAFGLRPSFTTHHPASAWSSPTLLGSIIPELGVIGRHGESNAYLAWQFPLEYRPYPRRQRPYTADERLAWFVSPQFLLELGDTSERWHAGVSTGVVVW